MLRAFDYSIPMAMVDMPAPRQRQTVPAQAGQSTSATAQDTPASVAESYLDADMVEMIKATAARLGISPVDLATVISYETGGTFDPMQPGPTTQWGQHRGLIQFGEPQAEQFGVDFSSREAAMASQLAPGGAIEKYLLAHGFRPGMSMLDLYSTINAGGPGLYDRSDANNGGAPGTVRDKVEGQMSGHRARALALLGMGDDSTPNPADPNGPERLYRAQSETPPERLYQPPQEALLFDAYTAGSMDAGQLRAYRQGVASGQIALPPGAQITPRYSADQGRMLAEAYSAGQMTPEQAEDYKFALAMGEIAAPVAVTPPRLPDEAGAGWTAPPTDPDPNKPFWDITADMASEGGLSFAREMWNRAETQDTQFGAMRDIALAGLGALGGLIAGAAGAVGDVAEAFGASDSYGKRIARDLAAMPEAFAGTPNLFPPQSTLTRAGTAGTQAATRAATTTPTVTEIGVLARRAATGGVGSRKAIERLAQIAEVDPKALRAAQRLGIDLPADIFARNNIVREAAGVTRSVAASDAAVDFKDSITRAATRADDVMREVGGARSIDDISDSVFRSLTRTSDDLASRGSELYDAVDAAVPAGTTVAPARTAAHISRTVEELGGTNGLTEAERRLYKLVTGDAPVTYARLMREKRMIGQALERGRGPYADADQQLLSKLYGALADDQMAAIRTIGGDDLARQLEVANGLWAQKAALEKQIVSAFGKDLEGSIAQKLITAVRQGSNGDAANLNRILRVVPEDLRGQAVMSAIAAGTQRTVAGERGFGFTQFTKFYSGLKNNPRIYKQVSDAIGPTATRALHDLYVVSKRIGEAQANVLTTGKANQALVQSMLAEGIVAKIFNSSAGRAVRGAVATSVGGKISPLSGAIANAAQGGARLDPNRFNLAGALFRSPQFQKLATEAATTGRVSTDTLRRTWRSPAYRRWAKAVGIDNPQEWLAAAVAAGAAVREEEQ